MYVKSDRWYTFVVKSGTKKNETRFLLFRPRAIRVC